MGKIFKTDVKGNFSIIELHYSYDNTDFINVYVYDKNNDKREFIGSTFEGVTYEFNENYVIFTSNDGIEIVFDIQAFDFVHDEREQLKAHQKMLESITTEEEFIERKVNTKESENYLVRKLK